MGLIAGFLLPLFQGVPLVLMSPFDWVAILRCCFKPLANIGARSAGCRISPIITAPAAFVMSIWKASHCKSMRAFINCSEPVRRDSHLLFLEHFGKLGVSQDHLAVSYAMAENVFAVTQTVPGQPARVDWLMLLPSPPRKSPSRSTRAIRRAIPQVSCGPTIANVHVRVIDPEGRPCPDRAVGELAISSDCLLTGYYHRDDLQPFDAAGWYRTGDRGYIAEGEVYVVGRSKDLIINAGKNIYPQDIEAVVNTVPGIYPGRAVVFGVFDEREGTELIAIVAEIDDEMAIDVRQIKRLIRQRISQQTMVTVNYVDLVGARWLIKTSSGKIARAANREKWLAERAR